jgi:hypothetical protein
MIYHVDDQHDSEQLHARQVGDALAARQQPQAYQDAADMGGEIDQQVERVRWLMRREPMLEVRELRIEN